MEKIMSLLYCDLRFKIMRKILLSLFIMLTLGVRANHWIPDVYQYPNNMTAIGVIEFNNVEQRSDFLEIGAFCDGECRGSAIARYEAVFDRYYVFIMIYGDNGDSIDVRCYDHSVGMEVDALSQTNFIFNNNAMIGDAVEPFVFSFELLTPIYYQVTAEADPSAGGTIDGVGVYLENELCTLQVTTSHDYVYEGLYVNETLVTNDTIYSFVVTSEMHFVAKFSENTEDPDIPDEPIYYHITATIEPDGAGIIMGLGEYQEGELCRLEMCANEGYRFVSLNENDEIISVEQNYSFEVECDRDFTVNFILIEGINEQSYSSLSLFPNPVNDKLIIEAETEIEEVGLYDLLGRLQNYKTARQYGYVIIDVSALNVGAYFARIKTNVGVVTKMFVKE